VVQQLKGYTSRILRKEFAVLRSRLPTLWTRSYYIESVGHISQDTVKKYIDAQKNRQDGLVHRPVVSVQQNL
jgi:putative transposase